MVGVRHRPAGVGGLVLLVVAVIDVVVAGAAAHAACST